MIDIVDLLFYDNGAMSYRIWRGNSLTPVSVGHITTIEQLNAVLCICTVGHGYSAQEARELITQEEQP